MAEEQGGSGLKYEGGDDGAMVGQKRKGEDQGGEEEKKKGKQETDMPRKNIPVHRNAFKRRLRKHTLLFQRDGGRVACGFIVTCDQGREAACINSAVSVIKDAISELGNAGVAAAAERGRGHLDGREGEEKPGGEAGTRSEEGNDVEEGEEESVGGGGGGDEELTWVVDAGCNGVCCVTVEKEGADPVQLLHTMWDMVGRMKQVHKFVSRHKVCYKWLPCQVFCKSDLEEILSTCRPLLEPIFGTFDKPSDTCVTFAVMCDVRSCDKIKRMQIIEAVAGLVNPKHRVSLSAPQTVILIQIIKSACGVSVISGASKFFSGKDNGTRFNLVNHARAQMPDAQKPQDK